MTQKMLRKILASIQLILAAVCYIVFIYGGESVKSIFLTIALILTLSGLLFLANKKEVFTTLYSKYAEKLTNEPWQEYPRPQLMRKSYQNLNGIWEYSIKPKKASQPKTYSGEILVPFPLESALSKVKKQLKKGQILYYKRNFLVNEDYTDKLVFLHFGAVDQIAHIYLNGNLVHTSYNGYLPFSVEISKYLLPENELVVKVEDDLNNRYPYGKQSKKRGGIWYTKTSGIWQTVWLEVVNKNYIKNVKYDIDYDKKMVTLVIDEAISSTLKTITINDKKYQTVSNTLDITFDDVISWSPENPYLYDVKIETETDDVTSYFAFRKLSIETINDKQTLCLNNKPYFFNGLLDQGYFSDGIYLPASLKAYEDEIQTIKELGFNTLRKHIKIEPLLWYHLCDKKGIIVWQDMVNNGKYHFIRDTALPNFGIKNLNDKKFRVNKKTKEVFIQSMEQTVKHLYNVPSICLWTIFNEGWGQFDSAPLYKRLKELDNSRFVDTNSGWFDCGVSDVKSLHIYFKPIEIEKSDRPIILSEFGGFGHSVAGHYFNVSEQFSYGFAKSEEELSEKFKKLYETEIIPLIEKGLCAAIYTQVSDVEDELNGLFTFDRYKLKFNKEVVKEVNKKINEYNERGTYE